MHLFFNHLSCLTLRFSLSLRLTAVATLKSAETVMVGDKGIISVNEMRVLLRSDDYCQNKKTKKKIKKTPASCGGRQGWCLWQGKQGYYVTGYCWYYSLLAAMMLTANSISVATH
jgi:hypothetical protein